MGDRSQSRSGWMRRAPWALGPPPSARPQRHPRPAPSAGLRCLHGVHGHDLAAQRTANTAAAETSVASASASASALFGSLPRAAQAADVRSWGPPEAPEARAETRMRLMKGRSLRGLSIHCMSGMNAHCTAGLMLMLISHGILRNWNLT
eukprot:3437628-Pyramimonas_sp.AAC.1